MSIENLGHNSTTNLKLFKLRNQRSDLFILLYGMNAICGYLCDAENAFFKPELGITSVLLKELVEYERTELENNLMQQPINQDRRHI